MSNFGNVSSYHMTALFASDDVRGSTTVEEGCVEASSVTATLLAILSPSTSSGAEVTGLVCAVGREELYE